MFVGGFVTTRTPCLRASPLAFRHASGFTAGRKVSVASSSPFHTYLAHLSLDQEQKDVLLALHEREILQKEVVIENLGRKNNASQVSPKESDTEVAKEEGGRMLNCRGNIETVEDIKLVEYMYCAQYGGFAFSDEFLEEYEQRYGKPFDYYDYNNRSDQDAIALFKERGQLGTCLRQSVKPYKLVCRIELAKVPLMYLDYIIVHEYDGLERLSIDHSAYICDKLKRLDPNDVDAVAALLKEATDGPVHEGENMV